MTSQDGSSMNTAAEVLDLSPVIPVVALDDPAHSLEVEQLEQ